jgi:hypothetical protein
MSDQTGRPGPEQPADAEQPAVQQPVAQELSAQEPVDQALLAQEQPGTWGAPAQERPAARWSWKKTAAATAVAVGVAVGGGFAVYAAGNATADSGDQRGGPGMMGGGPGGGMGGRGGGAAGLPGALHGEFVTADGNGGYARKLVQTGEVTAVSDTSITAKSADGYTKTYTIDSATVKTAVETGDQVTVLATDAAKAESISERGGGMRGGLPGGQQQGVPPRRDGTAADRNGVPAPSGN